MYTPKPHDQQDLNLSVEYTPQAHDSMNIEISGSGVVDPTASSVSAISPVGANGQSASIVTVVLVDTLGNPITGLVNADFSLSVSGSGTAGTVSETTTAGTYEFDVTNTQEETVTITVTVNSVQLDDQPQVVFELIIVTMNTNLTHRYNAKEFRSINIDLQDKVRKVTPSAGATGVAIPPTLEWEAFPNHENYFVEIATDSGFTNIIQRAFVKGTSFSATNANSALTEYYWRVSVAWESIKQETTPTPPQSSIDSVTISGGSTLQQSSTLQLSAQVNGTGDFDSSVTWSSSATSIATVDQNGLVTYVAGNVGTEVVITATATDGTQGTTTLTISGVQSYLDSEAGDIIALQDLYASTNGANWNNNTGWTSSGMSLNPAPYGVGVEEIGGELRVTWLKLNGTIGFEADGRGVDGVIGGNNLVGTLNDSIGNLKKCHYLNIKQNELTGELPSGISELDGCVRLILNGRIFDPRPEDRYHHPGKEHETASSERSNEYTGGFPELPTAGNLEILELLGNNVDTESGLSGNLNNSLSNQTSLRGLMIDYHNYLNGSLFDYIKDLPSLEQINVSNNSFSEVVPESINNTWNNIRYINLSDNEFNGTFPNLSGFQNTLYVLLVRGNNFTGNVEWLGDVDWQELITVRFDWNYDMSGGLPNETYIGSVGRVTFSFNGLGLTGGFPQELTSWKGIQLNLRWNNFSGELPQTGWENFTDRLRTMGISTTRLTGNIPSGLINNAINNDLQNIFLYINDFTSFDSENCNDITNGSLHIENNRLTPKDIVPLIGRVAGEYNYGNQGAFDVTENLPSGSTIDFSSYDYTGNVYTWYKDGVVVSGESNPTIDTSVYGDGQYRMEIDHPQITQTFTSRIKTII